MERDFCLGEECPDKRCEICPAKKCTMLDVTDNFRNHPSISPNGYYSSGGIVRIRDKETGEIRYAYSRFNE